MTARVSEKTDRLACRYQEFRISYLVDAIKGKTDSKIEYINKSDVKTGKLDPHIEEDALYSFFKFDKEDKKAYLQLVQPGDYKIRDVFCKLLKTRTNKLIPSDRDGFEKHLKLVDILLFLAKLVEECLTKSNGSKQKNTSRYRKEIKDLRSDIEKYNTLRDEQYKLYHSEDYHMDAYGRLPTPCRLDATKNFRLNTRFRRPALDFNCTSPGKKSKTTSEQSDHHNEHYSGHQNDNKKIRLTARFASPYNRKISIRA